MALLRHEGFLLLFQYPQFAKRWIGTVVSSLGSQMGWIALIWLVMHLTDGASAIGVVTLLYQLPAALVAPIAGVVLDRYSRVRVMAVANFILAVIFAAIPVVATTLAGQGVWLVYLLILVAGLTVAFDTTGSGPLIAELIPAEKLEQANFLRQSVWQIAYLIGPGLGGVLIALIGTAPLLYADAATFLMLGFIMFSIPATRDHLETSQDNPLVRLKEGLSYLLHRRSLLALAILTFFFNLVYGPYEVILPNLAKTHLGGSASLGLLWFVFAVGALVAGVLFSARSWPFRVSVSLSSIIVLWGVVTFAFAYSTQSLWAAAISMFAGGVVFSPWGALASTARLRVVPQALHGRVFGVSSMITAAGMPIGAWLTGILLPLMAPRTMLLAVAGVNVIVGVLGYVWPSFRRLDEAGDREA